MKRIHVRPNAARSSAGRVRGPAVTGPTKVPHEPAMCERCGAIYLHKTWRAGERARRTSPVGVGWVLCPACVQVADQSYDGRVRILGALAPDLETEVWRRIQNVEARARHTQPERRTVRIDRERDGIEVLTTSQELAHRIARELEKAFGGKAHYCWSDRDGSLEATWEPRVALSR